MAIGGVSFFIIVASLEKVLAEDEKAWTVSRTENLGVDSNGDQTQETGGFQ